VSRKCFVRTPRAGGVVPLPRYQAPAREKERSCPGSQNRPAPSPGGVDTHADVHVAAVVDQVGRVLGTQAFPATAAGYRAALAWMSAHGELAGVGVEGTGSYGAGLARYLAACGIEVAEVIRPNRQARRQRGKSDTADAVAAALAALSGEASAMPKSRDGAAEAGPGAAGGPGRRGQGPHPGRQPAA
jgi:Transposase